MILVPTRSISRVEIGDALLTLGYEVVFREPATASSQMTTWERGGDKIVFSSDAHSGLAVFVITSVEPSRVEAQIAAIVPCEPVSSLVKRGLDAELPSAQAIAALRFIELGRFTRADESIPREQLIAGLSRWMTSDHRAVRTAAGEAPFTLEWVELDPAIEAMAANDPALAWIGPWWKKSREDAEKRARVADEKRARADLESSLDRLVDEKRWDEALSASEKALTYDEPSIDSLRARALAFEGVGRSWEAFFWASVWAAKTEEDDGNVAPTIDARDRIAASLSSDPSKLESHVRLALDRFDDEPLTAALSTMREKISGRFQVDEIAFFESVLLVQKSFIRSKQRLAIPLLETFVKQHPAIAEAWILLAQARAANEDLAGAEAAYGEARRSASTHSRTSRESELATFANDLDVDKVSDASVLGALRRMYANASDHASVYRVTTDELALDLPQKSRAAAIRARAIAATFLERHDDAIDGYRSAMAAGDEDEAGLLRFNLACELARSGRKDEAIASLKEAIERDAEWGDKARADDYFSSIWDDREFIVVVSGLTQTPTRDEVESWITRSLGWSMRGDGDESVAEANRAVARAMLLEDRALLARALGQLGSAQTYYVSSGVSAPLRSLERRSRTMRSHGHGSFTFWRQHSTLLAASTTQRSRTTRCSRFAKRRWVARRSRSRSRWEISRASRAIDRTSMER
jgi:tetratricopeptide (TPR) repeat protein